MLLFFIFEDRFLTWTAPKRLRRSSFSSLEKYGGKCRMSNVRVEPIPLAHYTTFILEFEHLRLYNWLILPYGTHHGSHMSLACVTHHQHSYLLSSLSPRKTTVRHIHESSPTTESSDIRNCTVWPNLQRSRTMQIFAVVTVAFFLGLLRLWRGWQQMPSKGW